MATDLRWRALVVLVFISGLLAADAPAEPRALLTGRVGALETGEPLEHAIVVVIGAEERVVTGPDGRFAVPAGGGDVVSVRVSLHGHRPIVVELERGIETTIWLQRDDAEIIDIEGESPETAVRRSPFAVSVVSTDRLAGRATDLETLIDRAAGVRVRRTGGLGSPSQISLRGLGGKRVEVYINGRPLNLASGTLGLDEIPVQFIERIEIYKGVVPAWLGGDGTAGAINLVTKDLADNYSEASYTIGSYNTHQVAGVVRRSVARGVVIGGGGFFSHAANDYVMDSPYQPGLRIRRDHDEFTGFTAVAELALERHYFDELELEVVWLHNDKQVQGIQQNIQHARTSADVLVGIVHATRDRFLVPDLRLDYSLSAPMIRGRLVDDSPVRYQFDGSTVPSPFGQGEIGPLPQDRTTDSFELRQRVNLAYRRGRHTFNANHVARAAWSDAEDPLADEAAGRTVGDLDARFASSTTGFAHELRLGRVLNSASAKHYLFDSSGLLIDLYAPGEPESVGVRSSNVGFGNATRVEIGDDVFVRAAYERTWRLPDTSELFGDGFLVSPAPRLRPESGHQTNVGVFVDRMIETGRLRAELNAFGSWLSDAITLGSNVLTRGYVNLGEVRVLGADTDVAADVTRWLHLRSFATYQDVRDVRRTDPGTGNPNPTFGVRVPNVPWLYGGVGFELHWRGLLGYRDEIRVYGETSYTAEYYYGWQLSDNQMRTIPRRLTQTLGTELLLNDGRVAMSFEVDNVTDVRVIDVYNNPLPGRTFAAKLRVLRF